MVTPGHQSLRGQKEVWLLSAMEKSSVVHWRGSLWSLSPTTDSACLITPCHVQSFGSPCMPFESFTKSTSPAPPALDQRRCLLSLSRSRTRNTILLCLRGVVGAVRRPPEDLPGRCDSGAVAAPLGLFLPARRSWTRMAQRRARRASADGRGAFWGQPTMLGARQRRGAVAAGEGSAPLTR